jgi:hypothetical protein
MTDMGLQRWSESLLRKPRRTDGDRNTRFLSECGARTTKNQLKANGGLCHACKAVMK